MSNSTNKDTRHYAHNDRTNITSTISSNPYHPLTYSRGTTHTCMLASWMVDGEALVVMAVMISSNSPSSRVPERRLLIPILGFGTVAAERNSFSSSPTIFGVFRLQGVFCPKEESGGHTGWPHPPPGTAQGGGAPGPGVGPPWAFCTFPSGSVGL